jgi:hypothetical protein
VTFFANVLRSGDLLNFQLEFVNLVVDSTNPAEPRLRRETSGDAFIVLRLPPQHIAEDSLKSSEQRAPPYEAFLASPSRLAFQLPAGDVDIDFNLRSILEAFKQLPLKRQDASPPDSRPGTFVEFPDRLLLVPDDRARLWHRSTPLDEDTQLAELWHTRFVVDAKDKDQLRFRAVSNPVDNVDRPLNPILTRQDRTDIVSQSTPANPYVIASPQFMLSALGTTTRLRSTWATTAGTTDLAAWLHDSRFGRDRYVRTVRNGILFPFGHRTSLETITQRELLSFDSTPYAALQQSESLTVAEMNRSYDDREMPFTLVQIVSAQLQPASDFVGPHRVCQVSITATDRAGNVVNCETRALFLPLNEGRDPVSLNGTGLEYAGVQRPVQLNYQPLAIAENPGGTSDTSVNVTVLTFGVKILQASDVPDPAQPLFLPILQEADASIPALERMQGTVVDARAPRPVIKIRLSDQYKQHGYAAPNDVKQVFAQFESAAIDISIPPQRGGGLAAPQFKGIDGLSRTMGPVMGVQTFAARDELVAGINPLDLVGQAKILGSIALADLIETVEGSATDFLATARPSRVAGLCRARSCYPPRRPSAARPVHTHSSA